ncbi:hypothetical protein GOODEAATRI_005828 [Goodea atripinnis]|uniref:Uncharacterized protein n=1 Tax=Goodea atripinnis TaxID=208336 RepID=A0ABV0PLG0_9TELE
METATAERDREIAALQADLGSVRTELEHWKATAAKYEEEINRLQEAFAQQQQQHNAASQLQGDPCSCVFIYITFQGVWRRGVTEGRRNVQLIQVGDGGTKQQSLVLSSSLESLEKRKEVLQDKLGSLENQHLQDASRLKNQLDQAQARTHTLQKEVLDHVRISLFRTSASHPDLCKMHPNSSYLLIPAVSEQILMVVGAAPALGGPTPAHSVVYWIFSVTL